MWFQIVVFVIVKMSRIKLGCGKRLPTQGMITPYCGSSHGTLCENCRKRPINRRWLKRRIIMWWKFNPSVYDFKQRYGPTYSLTLPTDNPLVTETETVDRWPSWLVSRLNTIESFFVYKRWQGWPRYRLRLVMIDEEDD